MVRRVGPQAELGALPYVKRQLRVGSSIRRGAGQKQPQVMDTRAAGATRRQRISVPTLLNRPRALLVRTVASLLMLASCAMPARHDLDQESLAVYRAVVERDGRTPPFVVRSELHYPGAFKTEDAVRTRMTSVSAETANDWVIRNTDAVEPRFPECSTTTGFVVVTESELGELILFPPPREEEDAEADGWEGFRTAFPDASGVYGFSLVGFNSTLNEALVWVTYSCGPLCGSGSLMLLERDGDGDWGVVKRQGLWISDAGSGLAPGASTDLAARMRSVLSAVI